MDDKPIASYSWDVAEGVITEGSIEEYKARLAQMRLDIAKALEELQQTETQRIVITKALDKSLTETRYYHILNILRVKRSQ